MTIITERAVLDLLRARYSVDQGNGPRYVGAEHVRSHAGFDAKRTCDYIAMDLWPSKGLAIHGHEIKVSRSDWLRELKDPSKAAEFMRHCDYWWLVAPKGVAKPDELPDGWGLMEPAERTSSEWRRDADGVFGRVQVTRTLLRVVKAAPALAELQTTQAWWRTDRPDRGTVAKSFAAALLRSAVRTEATRKSAA